MARALEQPAPWSPEQAGGPGPAISVSDVSKSFEIPSERYSSVRERVLRPLHRHGQVVLPALDRVSFEVAEGEFFGVVGKNGSGKSTLMRCLAGIYPVDSGRVAVEGRLVPFIELGVGFNAEMEARDNVLTNAVMFGLSRREAAERFDDIIAFAELERFVHQRLKNYSSGMAVRLAFSTTVHVDADVMLFDEVLAVGDAAFQRKCLDRFELLRRSGKTVVIVTHDMEMITRLCDRALLLHHGREVALGPAAEVAREYGELNAGRRPAPRPAAGPAPDAASGAASSHSPLLGADPRRFATLMWTLAVADLKLKYFGTALNWAWAVARPLALFGGLLLLFSALHRFSAGISHYPAYLLTGIVLWTFFAQVTANSVQSLAKHAGLLRKLPFPHLAVPAAAMLAGLFDLCINLLLIFVLLVASGIEPRLSWLELPLLLGLLVALTAGVSLLLSAMYVRFRDVDQVWQVASSLIFFLTPVFYVASSLPERFHKTMLLVNPIATVLTQARHALIDSKAPTAAELLGGHLLLAVPVTVTAGMLVLGTLVFRRESPRAAETV